MIYLFSQYRQTAKGSYSQPKMPQKFGLFDKLFQQMRVKIFFLKLKNRNREYSLVEKFPKNMKNKKNKLKTLVLMPYLGFNTINYKYYKLKK